MKVENLVATISVIVLITAALLIPDGGHNANADELPPTYACPGNYNDCQTLEQHLANGCALPQGTVQNNPIDMCCPKASQPTKGTKITGLQIVIYGPVVVQCPNQGPITLSSSSGKYCEHTEVSYGAECDLNPPQ